MKTYLAKCIVAILPMVSLFAFDKDFSRKGYEFTYRQKGDFIEEGFEVEKIIGVYPFRVVGYGDAHLIHLSTGRVLFCPYLHLLHVPDIGCEAIYAPSGATPYGEEVLLTPVNQEILPASAIVVGYTKGEEKKKVLTKIEDRNRYIFDDGSILNREDLFLPSFENFIYLPHILKQEWIFDSLEEGEEVVFWSFYPTKKGKKALGVDKESILLIDRPTLFISDSTEDSYTVYINAMKKLERSGFFARRGNYEEALVLLEELNESSIDWNEIDEEIGAAIKGKIFGYSLFAGEYEKAAKIFNEIMESYPFVENEIDELYRALPLLIIDEKKAEEVLNNVDTIDDRIAALILKIMEKEPTFSLSRDAYIDGDQVAFREGRYEEVRGEDKSLKGASLAMQGHFDEAIVLYTDEIATSQDPEEAYIERALVYYLQGDMKKTFEDLQEAEKLEKEGEYYPKASLIIGWLKGKKL